MNNNEEDIKSLLLEIRDTMKILLHKIDSYDIRINNLHTTINYVLCSKTDKEETDKIHKVPIVREPESYFENIIQKDKIEEVPSIKNHNDELNFMRRIF